MENCASGTPFKLEENFACRAEEHNGPCSMGIDTRGVLDVRISSIGTGNKRVAEHIGKYSADTLDGILGLIRDYNVKVVCIDIGPEEVLAKKLQRIGLETGMFVVYRVKYKGRGKNREFEINDIDGILTVDRSESLEMTKSDLTLGMNILPENYDKILNGVYKDEMTASYITLKDKTDGTSVKIWKANGADHQYHCDNYCRLAFKILTETCLSSDDIHIG